MLQFKIFISILNSPFTILHSSCSDVVNVCNPYLSSQFVLWVLFLCHFFYSDWLRKWLWPPSQKSLCSCLLHSSSYLYFAFCLLPPCLHCGLNCLSPCLCNCLLHFFCVSHFCFCLLFLQKLAYFLVFYFWHHVMLLALYEDNINGSF